MDIDILISSFVLLWSVIDPIGTIPVFIAVTKDYEENERKKIARNAIVIAAIILLFFLVLGEVLLSKMGVPLSAFQVSGGIILLLFALDMIFGNSKPEGEIKLLKPGNETAVFPLAIPSIAGPGSILAVILMTDNSRHSLKEQVAIAVIMCAVLFITYICMRASSKIDRVIGKVGAILISKVMGVILASLALTNILLGIKEFFKIN